MKSTEDIKKFIEYKVFSERMDYSRIFKTPQINFPNRLKWSDETKRYILEFINAGASSNIIFKKTGISKNTIKGWIKKFSINDERIKKRKDLVREWYIQLKNPDEIIKEDDNTNDQLKQITLDDYLSLNKDSAFEFNIAEIGKNILELYNAGYIFPYLPKSKDAYALGYLFGNGTITTKLKFSLELRGIETFLKGSNLKVPKLRRNNGIYSTGIGRLYNLLGMPLGAKENCTFFIPDWIFSDKDYRQYFLAGFIDSRMRIYKNTYKIEINIAKNPKKIGELGRFGLFCYVDQIQRLFEEEGITTRNSSRDIWNYIKERSTTYGKVLTARIIMKYSKENLIKIARLPLKNVQVITNLTELIN